MKILQRFSGKQWKDWRNINVCIIISTGRTGTKFIAEQFKNVPEILAEHEPRPNGEEMGYAYLRGDITHLDVLEFLESARKNVRKNLFRRKCSYYVESNGGLIFMLPVLREMFPNLRVAHIVRDPRDFVRSGCSRVYYSKDDGHEVQAYLAEDKWKLKSSQLKNNSYYERWSEMKMPERFMWMWSLKNEYVRRFAMGNDYVKVFRFEDIFFNERYSLEFTRYISYGKAKELSLLSLGKEKVGQNRTKKFYFPDYDNWCRSDVEKLNEHCGNLMKIYGYF